MKAIKAVDVLKLVEAINNVSDEEKATIIEDGRRLLAAISAAEDEVSLAYKGKDADHMEITDNIGLTVAIVYWAGVSAGRGGTEVINFPYPT